ncbi:IS66 family transposase (plasmid) [Methylomarinum sp. Ch1-1]|uniref:IS66 family transposase n=1 Tax=Methylomarinum roseum TaxID=3067653 RepID=A0AAU7NP54_9GAMM
MANLDKTSVRQELDRVKADFEALRTAGKVTPESLAVMNSLFMIVELILAIFLERTTRKDNRNSSLPSSQTGPDDSALVSGSQGKGKRLDKRNAVNSRTVETVSVSTVSTCEVCGESLTDVPCRHHERRTKIDIVFEKVVEHVDAEVKTCPVCQTMVKGRFPDDLAGPLQYGDGLKAFATNLLVGQMVALNRVQQLIGAMMDTVIAEATLLNWVLRCHQALEAWEQQAIEQLLAAPVMYVDETSLRVDRKNQWIHVYAAGSVTLKRLHRKRGKAAIEAIHIIPRYGGVIVHDCWASYFAYEDCKHGLCGSHLLRELTFIVDAHQYRWAKNMKRLLQETCVQVSKKEEKCLSDRELANLQKRYRATLTRGEKELPPIPPKPSGKRGKIAKSDAHNLWERLKTHEASVLLFARHPAVAFTNNRAEQDLRMAKVKQKVSGCFRSEDYAHAYCRISSYLQTMANKGYNPLTAIQLALAGKACE